MWQVFKSDQEKVAEFCRGRMPQTDGEFVAACDLPDTPEAARIALAVRRAAAVYGLVDPLFVRASDRYPDELVALPRWDSLDWVEVVLELERQLDTPLDEKAVFARLPHPPAVKDVVWSVYEHLRDRGVTCQGP
jgi:acyl carrier protein